VAVPTREHERRQARMRVHRILSGGRRGGGGWSRVEEGGRGEGGGGGGREWVRARRAGDRPGLPCRVLSYEDGALLYYKVVIL
jgi:hypothetical protein